MKQKEATKAKKTEAGGAKKTSASKSRVAGRYSSTVQAKGKGSNGASNVHDIAASGVSGSGAGLPYGDSIQEAFGQDHDISSIRAHSGSEATAATDALGAHAYASGESVAFGSGQADLHTAAHEAAHVVQQRAGVNVDGGVGTAGDVYEQHADKVADQVVAD